MSNNDNPVGANLGLEEFVDRLVVERNFGELDSAVLAQIKADLVDRLEDRINARILERMPADQLGEFEQMLDHADGPALQQFVASHIPDLQDLVATELLGFRTTYLNV